MSKQTGVWLDSSKAVIVTFENGIPQVSQIESNIENRIYHDKEGDKGTFMGSQHISQERTFEERKNNQFDSYLTELMTHFLDCNELYLFGPAEAKLRLKQKIQEEKRFSNIRLRDVETADSMTTNQIVAQVREYFEN